MLVLAAALALGCTTLPARTESDDGLPLTIVSYNIRHGRGSDDKLDLSRTANVLRALRADVIALQEVDDRVQRSASVDEAATLGAALGMQHAFGSFMPYQGGRYGLAILSRFPIVASFEVRLPVGNEPRVAIAAELALPGGRSVMAVGVHFDWVEDDGFRFAQAKVLREYLDMLTMPYIVLGDFNDEPGSRTLALFLERAVEIPKPADARFTFSSTEPVKEIDFVFVAPAQAWRVGSARVIDERLASDHRPVSATAQLLGGRSR